MANLVGTAPGAPVVTATNHIYNATVSWTHPADNGTAPVRFYFLYRNFGSGVPFNETLASWLMVTSKVDESTLPGQFYNYTVRAVSTYGEGTPMTAMVFVGGTGSLPSAPQNLTAFGSNHTVFLAWDNPVNPSAHGIENITVFRSLSSTTGFAYVGNMTTDFFLFTFYDDATVTNGQKYYYKVAANNANGAGPFSNVVNATPSNPILPFKVYLASAYPGNHQVLVTWSENFNATGYEIFRGTTAGGEGASPLTTVGGGVFYWFDDTTVNGQAYYYEVRAMNGAVLSQFSDEASATPGPGSVPAAPTDLMASPTSGGPGIALPFATTSNITLWYEVFRGNSSGAESATPIANESSFSKNIFLAWSDPTAASDVNYFYTVKVRNMYGWSAASNEVSSFKSPTGDRPDPVSGVMANGGAGTITVSWSSPTYQGTATILVYTIYRNTTSGWEPVGLHGTGLGATSWVDSSVLTGVTYTYKVMVENYYGKAIALSNTASAASTAGATVPTAPLNLHATSGTGYVLLGWDAPASNGGAAVTGYTVWRGTTLGSLTSNVGSTTGALTFNDTTGASGVLYYYAVKATNSVGASAASNVVTGTATSVGAPSAPQNLAAASTSSGVRLTWTAPANSGGSSILNYSIYRNYAGGAYALIGSVPAGTLSYVDTNGTMGYAYSYYVVAVNSAGPGTQPTAQSATYGSGGTVTYDNTLLYAGIIIVVIVVVLAGAWWYMRSKKKVPPQSPPKTT